MVHGLPPTLLGTIFKTWLYRFLFNSYVLEILITLSKRLGVYRFDVALKPMQGIDLSDCILNRVCKSRLCNYRTNQ